jgi:hypothetical protein
VIKTSATKLENRRQESSSGLHFVARTKRRRTIIRGSGENRRNPSPPLRCFAGLATKKFRSFADICSLPQPVGSEAAKTPAS